MPFKCVCIYYMSSFCSRNELHIALNYIHLDRCVCGVILFLPVFGLVLVSSSSSSSPLVCGAGKGVWVLNGCGFLLVCVHPMCMAVVVEELLVGENVFMCVCVIISNPCAHYYCSQPVLGAGGAIYRSRFAVDLDGNNKAIRGAPASNNAYAHE